MIRIEINCDPVDLDRHLSALGFSRVGGQSAAIDPAPQIESPLKRIAESTKNGTAAFVSPQPDERTSVVDAPNPLADELTALERPEDLAPPAATPGATRVRGQPAPGKKRRTAAEVAEDMAYLQSPEGAKAAETEKAAISTGEARINPADAAQDEADEAAESAQRAAGPPTMDDLRAAVKRYSDKFGPEAAIANVRSILGHPMLETPPEQIPNAIAKMDLATNGATVMGVGSGPAPSGPETSLFGGDNKRTSEIIGSDGKPIRIIEEDFLSPAPRLATRQDIIAAMTAYCVKFDGTNDPNKAPNGQADLPRIMEKACGAARISLLPQTPEGFGSAVSAIEEATKNNPFGRPVRT